MSVSRLFGIDIYTNLWTSRDPTAHEAKRTRVSFSKCMKLQALSARRLSSCGGRTAAARRQPTQHLIAAVIARSATLVSPLLGLCDVSASKRTHLSLRRFCLALGFRITLWGEMIDKHTDAAGESLRRLFYGWSTTTEREIWPRPKQRVIHV